MTTAQTLSARYDDDGQKWTDRDGVDLVDALDDASQRQYQRPAGDLYRFADGSWVVVMHGGWDVLDAEGFDSGGWAWVVDGYPTEVGNDGQPFSIHR